MHFVDPQKYYLHPRASRIRVNVPYSIEYKCIDSVPRIGLPFGETGGETVVTVHWETWSAA
ncbi:MAG: hypothetical protein OXO51_02930 [Gemmatimonadota bacterium]|nr:hypothetical protein [Gemmatimonadota bacterium]